MSSPSRRAVVSVEARNRPVTRLLLAHQSAEPDAFVESLAAAVAGIGGRDVVLLLIDYAHVTLTPHPDVLLHGSEPDAASLDGSMAGRAFTSGAALASERVDGWHVWVPVTEQSNRLGVLAMTLPRWDEEIEFLVHRARPRRRAVAAGQCPVHRPPASAAPAARTWTWRPRCSGRLLPPLCVRRRPAVTIAGSARAGLRGRRGLLRLRLSTPARLEFAVLDTVGHGLSQRRARRAAASAPTATADEQGTPWPNLRRVSTPPPGRTRVHPPSPPRSSAGSTPCERDADLDDLRPPAAAHRAQRRAHDPGRAKPGLPLGIGALGPVVGDIVELQLQRGDGVLLYTDGVTDSLMSDDTPFGDDRLRDLLAREHAAGASPQEVVRRLLRTAIEHSATSLRDDATLVYLAGMADYQTPAHAESPRPEEHLG